MPNTFITTSAPFVQTQYTAPVDALTTVGGDSTYASISALIETAGNAGSAELLWNNARIIDVTTGIIYKLYTLTATPTGPSDWHYVEEYAPTITVLGRSKNAITNIAGSIPNTDFYVASFVKGGLYLVMHQTSVGKQNGVYISNATGTSTTFTRYPELPQSNIPIQRTIVYVVYNAADTSGSGHFYRCGTGEAASAYTYYKDDFINDGLISKISGGGQINGNLIISGLTSSSAVATDGSSQLVSVTNTGSGDNVLATSPTLITPILGIATATKINGLAITATGGNGTLTIPNSGSIILSGAFSLTHTIAANTSLSFGATGSIVVVSTTATQTLTGKKITLAAGTATAGTGPLYFTAGVNLTTPLNGAMEYDGTNLYFTPSAATRKTIAYTDSAVGSASTIVVADEVSDTTCFPLFVNSVTGTLAAKTNADLKYDAATDSLETKNIVASVAFMPASNGVVDIGSGTVALNNTYIKATGTINFGNGNVILTGAVTYLTSSKDIRISGTAGTDTTSTVTVGGTQTLTNKTLASAVFTGSPKVTPLTELTIACTGITRTPSLALNNTFFYEVTSGTGLLTILIAESGTLSSYNGTSFIISVLTTTTNITVKFNHNTTIIPGVGETVITLNAGSGLTYSGIILNGVMYGVVSPLFANLL